MSSRARSACTSPATPTCSAGWQSWGTSTRHCCPWRAGAHVSRPDTSTRAARRRRWDCSVLASRFRSTGGPTRSFRCGAGTPSATERRQKSSSGSPANSRPRSTSTSSRPASRWRWREPMARPRHKWLSTRNVVGGGLGIAVIVATFVFLLPRIADYRDVWGVVKALSWRDLALLAGATLLNLATYAPPWMAALPGLHFRQAFVVTQASTASTFVAPGGPAVGMALSFTMFRAWGFELEPVSLAVA